MMGVAQQATLSPPQPTVLPPRSPGWHAQDWREELQRAQARAWFHGPLPQLGGAAAVRTDPALPAGPAAAFGPGAAVAAFAWRPEPAEPRAGSMRPSGPGLGPHPSLHGHRKLALSAALHSLPQQVPAHADARVSGSASPSAHLVASLPPARTWAPASAAAAPAGARLPPSQVPGATADASARVHIEQGPDGVAVWLGLDGDRAGVAARAAALCAQLRRGLQGVHQRLATVVCNGHAIYTSHGPTPGHKETP